MRSRQPLRGKSSDTRGNSRRPSRPVGKRPRASKPVQPRDKETDGGDRLQKILAHSGVASRRECEELIRAGRVEVDHQVVTELGTRVDPQRQEIRVDGRALARPRLAYFAVNKPIGVVCTSSDPAGRPRVIDLLPPNAPRVYCVGRLDMTSEGLILLTNDGELANGLTHPRHGVEKIYQVQVAGEVERDVLAQLHRGVHLAEGVAQAKHVRIKSKRKRSTILEMVLDEGRNREIRRLLARIGHKVQKLKRVAVGPVRLGEMPVGAVRPLVKKEIEALQTAVARGSEQKASDNGADRKSASRREPGRRNASSRGPGKGLQKGHKSPDERTVIGG